MKRNKNKKATARRQASGIKLVSITTLDPSVSEEFKASFIKDTMSLPEPPFVYEFRPMGGDWKMAITISAVLKKAAPMTMAEIQSAVVAMKNTSLFEQIHGTPYDREDERSDRGRVRDWLQAEVKKGRKSAVRLDEKGRYTWIGPFGKPEAWDKLAQ